MFRRHSLRRKLAAAGAPPVPAERLRRLVKAIDAGHKGTKCVPLACPDLADKIRRIVGRIYRYPELRDGEELRRMPICTDKEMKCCNPYHWSRICTPEHCERIETFAAPDHGNETPPPPYSRCAMNEVQSKDHGARAADARRTDHERLFGGSVATDGEERQSWDAEWCRLAYWELTRRVGRQFGVRVSAVDVFRGDGVGCGSGRHGFCLDALDQKDGPQIEQVRRTRAKIGLGVTISLESTGVWVYNRSEEPVFISSPALDATVARALLVWRVPPGFCLRVYNPDSPPPMMSLPHIGPVDSRSVRISFAKGWGPKYSRRDVTGCPCWLEVMLAPPR